MVKQLLNKKADPNLSTNLGETPLISASAKGKIEVVQLLLQYGADLLVMTHYGQTALSLADDFSHSEVVSIIEFWFKATFPNFKWPQDFRFLSLVRLISDNEKKMKLTG